MRAGQLKYGEVEPLDQAHTVSSMALRPEPRWPVDLLVSATPTCLLWPGSGEDIPYLCLCHSLALRVPCVNAEVSPSSPGEGQGLGDGGGPVCDT